MSLWASFYHFLCLQAKRAESETAETNTKKLSKQEGVQRLVKLANDVSNSLKKHCRQNKGVTSVVAAVTISIHGATLARMDTVITRKVEIAVRSITGSSGHELNNSAQNPDEWEFLSGTGNTQLITASTRSKLFMNHKWIDETRKTKLFPELKFK